MRYGKQNAKVTSAKTRPPEASHHPVSGTAQGPLFNGFMAFFTSLGGRLSAKRQEELVPVTVLYNALHPDTAQENHDAHSAPYLFAADWFFRAFLDHGVEYAAQLFHALWEEQRVIIQRGVSILVDKAYPPQGRFLRYQVNLEIHTHPSLPAHAFPVQKAWAERGAGVGSAKLDAGQLIGASS